MEKIQYISDANNNVTGVILPIRFWQKIDLDKDCLSAKKGTQEKKSSESSKPEGFAERYSRNFGRLRDKVKIVGDIVSPVSGENEWEVLKS